MVASISEHIEIGLDEVGRGALAGPVGVGAVILPKDFESEIVRDSKTLSEKIRLEAEIVIKREAIWYGTMMIPAEVIDFDGINSATFNGMLGCLVAAESDALFEYILVDGIAFPGFKNYPYKTIPQGDGYHYSIAAASIIAKNARDAYMKRISAKSPTDKFVFESNVGYGTDVHREAIKSHGPTNEHRYTFLQNILPGTSRPVTNTKTALF